MIIDLGVVAPGSTIRIPWSSFAGADGSQITVTNYAAADLLIYKDGGATERASTAGLTATTDFDSKTGKQMAVIDLADNTTSGFYTSGSEYNVAIDAVTIDGASTGGWIARFVIGYDGATLNTTIATLASQTSFTLASGPAEDDALNGRWGIIHDIASAVQNTWVQILDYTGSTKTVTLVAGGTFTVAAGDNFSLMGPMPIQATVLGRTLDVTATGAVGIDLANVENQSTTLTLSGTTLSTVTTLTGHTPQTGDVYALANGASGFVATKADTAAILLDTGTDGVMVADKTDYRLSTTGRADILATALTESYAADGAAGTLTQILYAIQQMMQEKSLASTTMTVKKLDGSTTAMTFTLNDATTPTSITRAS